MTSLFRSLLLAALLLPSAALASTTYTVMESVPGFESDTGSDLASYVVTVYKFGIWTVGIAALLMVVIGGIMHVTSAGNAASMAKAKGVIRDAVAGVLMALAGWLLLYEIDRDLVKVTLPDDPIYGDWGSTYTSDSSSSDSSGSSSSASSGSSSSTSIGTGCSAIVSAASAMKSSGCKYSQALRNSCNGNPGYTDCSNFVDTSYKAAGCSSPGNYSGTILGKASSITDGGASLRAGDVLAVTGHVVICENDGCKTVIHASGVKSGIKESNGSYYINNGAKAVRASNYCSSC